MEDRFHVPLVCVAPLAAKSHGLTLPRSTLRCAPLACAVRYKLQCCALLCCAAWRCVLLCCGVLFCAYPVAPRAVQLLFCGDLCHADLCLYPHSMPPRSQPACLPAPTDYCCSAPLVTAPCFSVGEKLTWWQLVRRAQKCRHLLMGYWKLPRTSGHAIDSVICPSGMKFRCVLCVSLEGGAQRHEVQVCTCVCVCVCVCVEGGAQRHEVQVRVCVCVSGGGGPAA